MNSMFFYPINKKLLIIKDVIFEEQNDGIGSKLKNTNMILLIREKMKNV